MAKRTRYSGRPPGRRTTSRPSGSIAGRSIAPVAPVPPIAPARSVGGLTDEELARAEALEAEIAERERAAARASARRRSVASSAEPATPGDVNAPLAVRMSHEYAYVARDVRRILLSGGLMVAILIVLDLLVNVFKVLTL